MHILIVDDDALAAEMVAVVVEDAGHSYLLAENAPEAAEILNVDALIDLIVCDMNMPFMSGLEFLSELREQGMQTPFILLTGDAPESLVQGKTRPDACLKKDFSLDESLPQIIRLVQEKSR